MFLIRIINSSLMLWDYNKRPIYLIVYYFSGFTGLSGCLHLKPGPVPDGEAWYWPLAHRAAGSSLLAQPNYARPFAEDPVGFGVRIMYVVCVFWHWKYNSISVIVTVYMLDVAHPENMFCISDIAFYGHTKWNFSFIGRIDILSYSCIFDKWQNAWQSCIGKQTMHST